MNLRTKIKFEIEFTEAEQAELELLAREMEKDVSEALAHMITQHLEARKEWEEACRLY